MHVIPQLVILLTENYQLVHLPFFGDNKTDDDISGELYYYVYGEEGGEGILLTENNHACRFSRGLVVLLLITE